MIRKELPTKRTANARNDDRRAAKLTIFAIPKRFDGPAGLVQRNAIRSWAEMQPHVEIILFGQDDPELEEIARDVDARVIELGVNEKGTPVLGEAFARAHALSSGQLLCYVNCDIIFGPHLLDVAERLMDSFLSSFLAIGQRTDLLIEQEIDWRQSNARNALQYRRNTEGKLDSVVCKDYFLFTRDLFQSVPAFLVGRGNWDNWMVANAKSAGVPVVDVTAFLPAIHQNHGHSHVLGGRKNAYILGEEARENQRLAKGRNLIRGSTATWQLTKKGPEKRRFPLFSMVRDMPKFLSLLRNLLFLGYLLAGTAFSI